MEKKKTNGEVSFLEKIVLLAINEKGWFGSCENNIKFGIAGAIIFELFRMKRITIIESTIVVTEEKPTGDPVIDKVFELIRSSSKKRSVLKWIQKIVYSKLTLRKSILKAMIKKNIVQKEEYSLFGVFYQFKYPITDTGLKQKIQQDIYSLLQENKKLSDHDLLLLLIMSDCKMIRKNFLPFDQYRKVSNQIKEISHFKFPLSENDAVIREIHNSVRQAIIASRVTLRA
jgi:predicted transcriptional regulator